MTLNILSLILNPKRGAEATKCLGLLLFFCF